MGQRALAAEALHDHEIDGGDILIESGQAEITDTTALTVFNPFEIEPADFRRSLDRRTENRNTMLGWIRDNLTPGVDYGQIHIKSKKECALGNACKNKYHFSKPSLFKPGSEKICGLLGLRPEFPAIADYERRAIDGGKIEVIILRCQLFSGDRIVAEGTGARIVAKDSGDINKSIKMALKSAQIDATLRCGGLSEIFTQDIEDMALGERIEEAAAKVDAKAEKSALLNLNNQMQEAKNLLHLQNWWKKHQPEIKALSKTDRKNLEAKKDVLKASLSAKAQREQEARQKTKSEEPKPETITDSQIEEIEDIIAPVGASSYVNPSGGSSSCLTAFERDKLRAVMRDPKTLRSYADEVIRDVKQVIAERIADASREMEGD